MRGKSFVTQSTTLHTKQAEKIFAIALVFTVQHDNAMGNLVVPVKFASSFWPRQ